MRDLTRYRSLFFIVKDNSTGPIYFSAGLDIKPSFPKIKPIFGLSSQVNISRKITKEHEIDFIFSAQWFPIKKGHFHYKMNGGGLFYASEEKMLFIKVFK